MGSCTFSASCFDHFLLTVGVQGEFFLTPEWGTELQARIPSFLWAQVQHCEYPNTAWVCSLRRWTARYLLNFFFSSTFLSTLRLKGQQFGLMSCIIFLVYQSDCTVGNGGQIFLSPDQSGGSTGRPGQPYYTRGSVRGMARGGKGLAQTFRSSGWHRGIYPQLFFFLLLGFSPLLRFPLILW